MYVDGSTVNIRYRHTPGTPKKCACILIVLASDNSIQANMCLYRDTGIYVPVSKEAQIFLSEFEFLGFFFRVFLMGFFGVFFFEGFFLGEFDDLRITSPNAYF